MLYFRSRVINYVERSRFSYIVQANWWRLKVGESGVSPRNNKYKVDVQTSKLVKNNTEYSVYGT